MGTPVPVREIVEAKRKEIEEKLLRELARHIKDNHEYYVNGYTKSLAKLKMNLYSAYIQRQERKVEEADLMGFSLDEVEVEDVQYRLISDDLEVLLSLPNGARYTIYVDPKPTYEMPKEEFEKYTALKEEVMREASKIAEQMRQEEEKKRAEEEKKQLEAKAKELETKVKELRDDLEALRKRFDTLVEFIRVKGLQGEFVKYVAEKRRQEEEEEIREEFEELFEEEEEEE